MTPIEKRKVRVMSNSSTGLRGSWYVALYVSPEKITLRYLIDSSKAQHVLKLQVEPYGVDPTPVEYYRLFDEQPIFKDTSFINQDNAYFVNIKGDPYTLVYESQLSLDWVKKGGAWRPHANVSIFAPALKRFTKAFVTEGLTVNELVYFSTTKETAVSKSGEHFWTSNFRRFSTYDKVLVFSVLDDTDNFETCSKIVKINNPDHLITNLTFTDPPYDIKAPEYEYRDMTDVHSDMWLTFKLDGPTEIAPNGVAEFEVRTFLQGEPYPDNSILELEMVDGYAPHRRIEVVNGVGKFTVQALGLKEWETLRFKVNDYSYSSRLERTLMVVNGIS